MWEGNALIAYSQKITQMATWVGNRKCWSHCIGTGWLWRSTMFSKWLVRPGYWWAVKLKLTSWLLTRKHLLSSIESATEPHVCIYLRVRNCASTHFSEMPCGSEKWDGDALRRFLKTWSRHCWNVYTKHTSEQREPMDCLCDPPRASLSLRMQ